ncbi:MAG: hypothetical protein U0176_13435 [Bacteroidia bacterium]
MVLRRDTIDGLSTELLSQGAWIQLGTAGFATGRAADLGLSHSGIPHVVAVDTENDGPPMAYHYVAGAWQHLGGLYVHNDAVSQPQLAFDPGAAYIIYRDEEEGQRNSVRFQAFRLRPMILRKGFPSGSGPIRPPISCTCIWRIRGEALSLRFMTSWAGGYSAQHWSRAPCPPSMSGICSPGTTCFAL